MKSIHLHKENKRVLSAYADGTFEETLRKLMDDVEDYMPLVDVDYSLVTSMKISDESLERLESFKLTDGESYENVVVRMLLVAEALKQ